MSLKMSNNAVARLSAPLLIGDTSLVLNTAEAASFPSPGAGEWHPITVADGVHVEILRATSRSSNVVTVVRAQEGTSAYDFAAGSIAEVRMTAGVIASLQADTTTVQTHVDSLTSDVAGDLTALETTVGTKASQAALDSLTTTVGTKAAQSGLNTLSATVAGLATSKANQSDLDSLAATKLSKAGDTMTGSLTIDPPSGQALLKLDKPTAADNSVVGGYLNASLRWTVQLGDGAAESGGNAGSNFRIDRYTDAGAIIDTPLQIKRDTGIVTANLAMPCAVGHRNGAGAVALGNNVWTRILLGTLASNVGGFTLGGNNLTVPKAGVYQVTAQVNIGAPTSIAVLVAGFNVNDNTSAAQYQARIQNTVANNYSYSLTLTRLLTLAAGDQLSLMAFCNVAGATASDGLGVTFIQAHMVAAT